MSVILQTGFVVSSLILWFQTNFVKEYFSLFGFHSLFKKMGIDLNEEGNLVQDLMTLEISNRGVKFLVNLLTCPFCVGLWLTIFSCLFYWNFPCVFVVYVLSWLVYSIVMRISQGFQ